VKIEDSDNIKPKLTQFTFANKLKCRIE